MKRLFSSAFIHLSGVYCSFLIRWRRESYSAVRNEFALMLKRSAKIFSYFLALFIFDFVIHLYRFMQLFFCIVIHAFAYRIAFFSFFFFFLSMLTFPLTIYSFPVPVFSLIHAIQLDLFYLYFFNFSVKIV